ncbi:MAG: hypothetical protein WD011_08970, partial [Nitriliruptoraceae bacterium]
LLLLATMMIGLTAGAAAADDAPFGVSAVLAAASGDPVGPEPMPRDAEGNAARDLQGYEDPEVPFTWGAAWILTFAGLIGVTLLVGIYYFGIHRPGKQSTET